MTNQKNPDRKSHLRIYFVGRVASELKMTHQPDPVNPDALIRVNIKFTLSFAAISFLIALVTTVVYSSTTDPKQRENITFSATAVATAMAGTSAFYALQSVKQNNEVQREAKKSEEETRKIEAGIQEKGWQLEANNQEENWKKEDNSQKLDRTLMFIRRWNNSQYSPSMKVMSEMLDLIENEPESQQPDSIKKILENCPDKKQAATNILNFLEEMSVCIERKILDEELLKGFYKLIVSRCCKVFSVFITERRNKTGSDKVFRGFTDLAEKWNQPNGS